MYKPSDDYGAPAAFSGDYWNAASAKPYTNAIDFSYYFYPAPAAA